MGNSQTNLITGNQIYSNKLKGIFLANNALNSVVKSNAIFGPNQAYGIYIRNVKSISNYGNNYYNNLNDIALINSTNSVVARNNIQGSLTGMGIYYSNSSSIIQLNTITNNLYGIKYNNGGVAQLITKNNIFDNTTNFNNLSGIPYVKITNNWWNSTIASTNSRRISGNGGYSNFTIYRLFGPFDITSSNIPLPRISWVTSYITNNVINVKWRRDLLLQVLADILFIVQAHPVQLI